MQIKLDDISKELAKGDRRKESIIKEINRSQWKLLFNNISNNEQDTVKIIYIGKFAKRKSNYALRKNKGDIQRIQKPDIQE